MAQLQSESYSKNTLRSVFRNIIQLYIYIYIFLIIVDYLP